MLASINPLGERGRGTTFGRTFTWYLIGSVAGGALVGAALGLLGAGVYDVVEPSRTAIALAVAIVCAAGLLLDLGLAGVRVPTLHRQVNENWLATYRGWVYGLGFGFQLGLGFATVMTTAAIFVMFALEVISGTVLGGLAIGVAFGLGRTLPLMFMYSVHEPIQLREMLRKAQSWARPAERMTRVAIAALSVAGLVAVAL
jgi:hypothetical protein